MSFKYFAEKVTDNHYVLPKTANMKVHADVFVSEKLYDMSDEATWEQIANACSYEGVTAVYIEPDFHLGYGCPIGCVIVTDDTLIQSCAGYDINCGITYIKIPGLSAVDVQSKEIRRKFIDEVELRIATGVGSGRTKLMPKFSYKEAEEILHYGAKAVGAKSDICERHFIPIPDDLRLDKIEKAYSKITEQLGSMGSGNHSCEMQVDKADGSVWVMLHSGSRGYGWQTANYFFHESARLRGIPDNQRENSWLYINEPLGKEYWAYHNSAANYAIANRFIMARGIQESIQEVFGVDAEVFYDISHNLIQEETLVLPDSSTKKGLVHRKGATRAFPAHHPDLYNTSWYETGSPALIPGSMIAGGSILFTKEGAYKSGCSVNHGSGRVLARNQAKRTLDQDLVNEEMATIVRHFMGVPIEGIISNHRNIPLDECGYVYKELDDVLAVLEAENIAKVERRLFPVANIKGSD